ncbi:MAG: hypothetical protein AAFZ63_09300 [Bacteroidota bacterium]
MKSRRVLAEKSLLGTSIGDAFGETRLMEKAIFQRKIPESTWEFTDDTVMSF